MGGQGSLKVMAIGGIRLIHPDYLKILLPWYTVAYWVLHE
jgi:hypothetical protein